VRTPEKPIVGETWGHCGEDATVVHGRIRPGLDSRTGEESTSRCRHHDLAAMRRAINQVDRRRTGHRPGDRDGHARHDDACAAAATGLPARHRFLAQGHQCAVSVQSAVERTDQVG
jgi:hypothetical protein